MIKNKLLINKTKTTKIRVKKLMVKFKDNKQSRESKNKHNRENKNSKESTNKKHNRQQKM